MKEFPYLKEVICLCVIVAGTVSFFYAVTEQKVIWNWDYGVYPPQQIPYYYEETVYPYRGFGLLLVLVGSLFLALSIVSNKLMKKEPF